MLGFLIYSLAWFLNRLPRSILYKLTQVLGLAIYYGFKTKRELILENLRLAFPKYTDAKIKYLAKKSCQNTVEMAILGIILPFWTESEKKAHFKVSPEMQAQTRHFIELNKPLLFLIPHFALMEAMNLFPLLYHKQLPNAGVIYRPLNNKYLDRWIKNSRQTEGLKLLSRKSGIIEAMKILKHNGLISLLFDQNAGVHGTLSLFMGRPVYSTPLPEIMSKKFKPSLMLVYIQKNGFLSGSIKHLDFSKNLEADQLIIEANNLLESLLRSDDNLATNWLWLHNRWSLKESIGQRFCSLLNKTPNSKLDTLKTIPRLQPIIIRLPNWLGDLVMLLPILKALRKARPELAFFMIGKKQFQSLIDLYQLAEKYIPLPEKKNSIQYWLYFWNLRKFRAKTHILFTNSFRADLEAFIIGSKERLGIQRPKKYRPLLTHKWKLPHSIDEKNLHQTDLWDYFMRQFGLKETIEKKPIAKSPSAKQLSIGLICGTENNPEKRWPVTYWTALIQKLSTNYPGLIIKLLGTVKDQTILASILQEIKNPNIQNLAGKTNIAQLVEELQSCLVVIGNDTGGLHLANALGITTIWLFGPTISKRTGPVFESPYYILKACNASNKPTASIDQLSVQTVYLKIDNYLKVHL